MKYLAAVAAAALAACSGSPADMHDSGSSGPTDASPGAPDPEFSTVITDRDVVLIGSPPVTVYVTLHDSGDVPVANADVQLVVTSGSVSVPPATDSFGRTTATWTNTVAGTYDVALLIGGVTVATHTVQFMPGSAAALVFVQQPTNVIAGADMSPQISVATVDSAGNTVPVGTGMIDLSLDPNPASAQLSGNNSWPVTAGIATFPEVYVDTPGTAYRIRAHLTGLTDAVSAPFDVAMGGADMTRSGITATPSSLQADGIETSTITVHVANAYGVAIASANVALSISGTHNFVSSTAGVTDANGDFTSTVSSTTAEPKIVTALVGGLTLTGSLHFFGPACTPRLPGVPGSVLGNASTALVVADLDGDGHADATAVVGSRPMLYRGRGDATFDPPVALPTVSAPVQQVKAADINGDGRLDLLMVIQNAEFVAIDLNIGGGQFAATTYAETPPLSVTAFTTGDFNRDGKLDLAIASTDGSLMIVLNAGSGNFTTGQIFANLDISDLGTVDLNGDGKPDLVLTNANGVASLLGNGDATFAAPVAAASTVTGNLVIGDFNNDGKPDCAVANQGWTLQPYLGTGTGAFTQVGGAIPTGQYNSWRTDVAQVAGARDLDGDGKLDIVLAEGSSLTIMKGGGDGTFAVGRVYAPEAIAGGLGDADGDGIADLIVMGGQLLSVLHGRSDGTFVAPMSHPEPDDRGGMFATSADFDGDGHADVVIQTSLGIGALLARPGGTLTDAATVAEADAAIDLKAGDVTGDGIADLVGIFAASPGVTVRVAAGAGDGMFAPFSMFAVPVDIRALQLADLDHDGKQDIVLTGYFTAGIWTARSLGDGTFDAPVELLPAREWAVLADINGDGNIDLISTDTQENLIFLGDGAGGLVLSFDYPYESRPLAADIDGDGHADILTVAYDVYTRIGSITVRKGLASGSFGPPLVTSGYGYWSLRNSALVDLTGDGALDLVGLTDAGLAVVPGYGDGYFYKQLSTFPVADGHSPTSLANMQVTDLDRDGRTDVVFWKGLGAGIAFNRGCVP